MKRVISFSLLFACLALPAITVFLFAERPADPSLSAGPAASAAPSGKQRPGATTSSVPPSPAPSPTAWASDPDRPFLLRGPRLGPSEPPAVPSLAPLASELDDGRFLRVPLLNDDLIVYYGSPLSPKMGILGRFPREELDERLKALAAEYDAANGERGVQRAFYLIYGTVWPGGDIGLLSKDLTESWIAWARERGILVFLDHQIGKYRVEQAMGKLLPWLVHPNVHLAIDPEWRTERPMKEIGFITGEELNQAQRMMSERMAELGIRGKRMLVVHEFNGKMIRGKETVRADWPGVALVHCADGFGAPGVKFASYKRNVEATTMPLKGFKLFYEWGVPGAGFDQPLLSPAQVLALQPPPPLIMYQ